MLEAISSPEYIIEKTEKTKDLQSKKQKIVIGKGGFGTVRFALSLSESDILKPGEVVCIKKTKEIGYENELSIKEIAKNTVGDFFADDIGDIVFAPTVYDMSIVTLSKEKKHNKGYLMQ